MVDKHISNSLNNVSSNTDALAFEKDGKTWVAYLCGYGSGSRYGWRTIDVPLETYVKNEGACWVKLKPTNREQWGNLIYMNPDDFTKCTSIGHEVKSIEVLQGALSIDIKITEQEVLDNFSQHDLVSSFDMEGHKFIVSQAVMEDCVKDSDCFYNDEVLRKAKSDLGGISSEAETFSIGL